MDLTPDQPNRPGRPHDFGDLGEPDSGRHIVYLDPLQDRPLSPYSPEGEIQMMGDFAAGLSRRGLPRPMVLALIAIILLPILVTLVAVITTWTGGS
jgi:hypothetical protein